MGSGKGILLAVLGAVLLIFGFLVYQDNRNQKDAKYKRDLQDKVDTFKYNFSGR